MDPLKSFEKKLLSGSLIDTSKLKQNRPSWLDPSRIPRIYRDLADLVSVPTGADVAAGQVVLDTAKVYQVLLASGLPQPILATIWDQCSKSAPGCLVRHEFYQALALVAMSQAGNQPNVQLLANLQNAPIPQLAIAGYPLPLAAAVQPHRSFGADSQAVDFAPVATSDAGTCAAKHSPSEPDAPAVDAPLEIGGSFAVSPSMPDQPAEEEDDFAEFQSAPSETSSNRSAVIAPTNNGISVPETSLPGPVNGTSLIPQTTVSFHSQGESHDLVSKPHITHSSTCQKSLKSLIVTSSPKQPKLLPSASLFDSITFPVTENVQPPSENNPWLNFSLETPKDEPSKKVKEEDTKGIPLTTAHIPETDAGAKSPNAVNGSGLPGNTDDEFDDFDDFQNAPLSDFNHDPEPPIPPNQDKYSVFRLLDESPEDATSCDTIGPLVRTGSTPLENDEQNHLQNPQNSSLQNPPFASTASPEKTQTEFPADILSLIKLPSIPRLENTTDNDLSQFDSLSLSSNKKPNDEDSTSALIELQDLDIGFSALDGPVASHPSSAEVSPAKSVASGQSVGESRGKEHRLSIFTTKANYAECASLSSFEMGPSTESNYSSPTKGSVVSLELNSRSPPDDENGDEDDTLEWTIEGGDVPQTSEPSPEKQRKGSDEFCWAQPPMFPPPDPTDSEKTSAPLNTGLFLQNFPDTQKKKVTRQQVAEGWHRILSKAAAILESASVILGDDPVVLGEILSTSKGQAYIASLLEVYNVTQQLKKSADLHGVEGLSSQVQQVDETWRGKLDDLATRLHLSVVCMDHLSSPIRVAEDICAICSLPLILRPPHILFGDNGYHSSCANFWANVLAEALPCLKLSP